MYLWFCVCHMYIVWTWVHKELSPVNACMAARVQLLASSSMADFLRQSVFLRPQHTVSASLASQWTPGSDRPTPSTGATEVHQHSQLLNICWGFKLRLKFVPHRPHACYPLGISPAPLPSISSQLFVFPPPFQIRFCLLPSTIAIHWNLISLSLCEKMVIKF